MKPTKFIFTKYLHMFISVYMNSICHLQFHFPVLKGRKSPVNSSYPKAETLECGYLLCYQVRLQLFNSILHGSFIVLRIFIFLFFWFIVHFCIFIFIRIWEGILKYHILLTADSICVEKTAVDSTLVILGISHEGDPLEGEFYDRKFAQL